MLPKYLIIEEYVVDKTMSVESIVDKIYTDYPQYRIITPILIKNPKGSFKICNFSLSLDKQKYTSSQYGI